MTSSDKPFDFDEWSTLFQQDPEAFERQRREVLESALAAGSPEQRDRMRAVLDAFNDRARSMAPEERAAEASRMAVDSMKTLGQQLDNLQRSVFDKPTRQRAASAGPAERRRRKRSTVH